MRAVTPASSSPLLLARGVGVSLGGQVVLRDVNLALGPGEFVALVGPNGAGKSTLLRVVIGLLHPDTGTVRLFGADPAEFGERWRLGYVPQQPTLQSDVPATVEEVVAAGRLPRGRWWGRPGPADREAVTHALEAVRLVELRRRRIEELSGGQRQRAFIAKALASSPELLILDEPVAGIDAESQRHFRETVTHLVREHGGAVLLVSHELGAVAADLDRVVVLRQTVLYDGTPSGLIERGVSLGVHREDLPLWLEGLR